MIGNTVIANRNTAHWTNNRVGVTPSIAAALCASEGDSPAFNRVLAGRVHFRHNGEIASEFFGCDGAKLYAARETQVGWRISLCPRP